jgi:hypothetical protein
MIDSSLNAPAKKNGAGGAYTWGSAADDPIDVLPGSSEAIGGNLVIGGDWTLIDAAPAAKAIIESEPFKGDLMDSEQFPSLSGKPGKAAPQPISSGADMVMEQDTMEEADTLLEEADMVLVQVGQTSSAPQAPLAADQLRPGSQDLFDASHPRNRFACKPNASAMKCNQNPQVSIDWSTPGIPLEVNKSLIKAGTPAHLGLYQHAKENRIPTQYLRPATESVQPSRSHRVQLQGKPTMVKQMFAKGCRGQR